MMQQEIRMIATKLQELDGEKMEHVYVTFRSHFSCHREENICSRFFAC
jgi:hypothetical protein